MLPKQLTQPMWPARLLHVALLAMMFACTCFVAPTSHADENDRRCGVIATALKIESIARWDASSGHFVLTRATLRQNFPLLNIQELQTYGGFGHDMIHDRDDEIEFSTPEYTVDGLKARSSLCTPGQAEKGLAESTARDVALVADLKTAYCATLQAQVLIRGARPMSTGDRNGATNSVTKAMQALHGKQHRANAANIDLHHEGDPKPKYQSQPFDSVAYQSLSGASTILKAPWFLEGDSKRETLDYLRDATDVLDSLFQIFSVDVPTCTTTPVEKNKYF